MHTFSLPFGKEKIKFELPEEQVAGVLVSHGFIAPGIGGYFDDLTGSFRLSLMVTIAIVLFAGVLSAVKLDVFSRPVRSKTPLQK